MVVPDLPIKGTPIEEAEEFETMLARLKEFKSSLLACESRISENAHCLKRLLGFMSESLIHFREKMREHSLIDLN